MDEPDVLRFKLFDDSASLAPSTAEPINLEDAQYSMLRDELEADAEHLEADSWSVAVDQSYLKALDKRAVKRQDVIYELIQTEMHHVRTLKIMFYVYMYEMKESLQMDKDKLERLFPVVEHLLALHQHFLSCLRRRRNEAQEQEDTGNSANNYRITQLADILISQFSGDLGENMKDCYGIFCSKNSDSSSLYKEQLQNNKKFQNLIRRIGQSPIVRRQGVPDCFLLVTQRITKYPVLVERILQNTEADTEEHESLVTALAVIRDTISQVDSYVNDYKNAVRLNVISRSLEPKSLGRLKGGRLFRGEDLVQGARTLLHEGTIIWRAASGKNKDIHAVLLTDVLLLLQEKDQKFVFATVDNKPSVISLQRLIVREVAHEDKAMFLICASSQLPEMYEIHTSSKADRDTWMTLIRDAVDSCPEGEEELYSEQEARATRLREFQEQLMMRDTQIVQSLTEKLQLFATYGGVETSHTRLLLRRDASDLQQGETLLKGAITEVENLQNMLMSAMRDCPQEGQGHGSQIRRAQTFAGFDSSPSPSHNENVAERPGSAEGSPLESNGQATIEPQLQEIDFSESQELSADYEPPVPCWNSTFNPLHEEEFFDRVVMLSQRLYSLQAIITQQDSQLEVQRVALSERERPAARHRGSMLLEQEKQRNLEKQRVEAANFQRLQAQHQQERKLWEKERERQRVQAEVLQEELQRREEECRRLEERLASERSELEDNREAYQQDLATLREAKQRVEKENEWIELQQKKFKKQLGMQGQYDNHGQPQGLTYYHSFRGDVGGRGALMSSPTFRGDVGGRGALMSSPTKSHIRIPTIDVGEVPPVPPRKESISPLPVKAEVPMHLVSTTNQSHKPAAVQQQIPTKLAALGKGKESKSFRTKGSHQRTHSAASIDMSQVVPIRVTGSKEGGSLRANRNSRSPQRIHHSVDRFTPPGPASPGMKASQSFSVHKRSSELLPPEPPPFPKDVPPFPKDVPPFPKDAIKREKERVIFL